MLVEAESNTKEIKNIAIRENMLLGLLRCLLCRKLLRRHCLCCLLCCELLLLLLLRCLCSHCRLLTLLIIQKHGLLLLQ